MAESKILFLLFAGHFLTCALCASTLFGDIEFSAKWKISGHSEHVVPVLTFRRENCYRRTQNCCYRYYSCGKHCKKNLCTQVPECSLYQKGECKRFRTIKVCKARCYHKMCPRYECAPLTTMATSFYQVPKPYKSVESANDDYKH